MFTKIHLIGVSCIPVNFISFSNETMNARNDYENFSKSILKYTHTTTTYLLYTYV